MSRIARRSWFVIGLVFALALPIQAAPAQEIFYKGKTIQAHRNPLDG